MCNLESISLIDMKLFLFTTTIQAIYLNISQQQQQNSTTGEVNTDPFFLQANLCNQKQLDWWTNCARYLFNRRSASKYSSTSPPAPPTVEALEATFKFSIDIKRQIELAKVLQLLRLKNSIVKCLDLESQETEKYQINLEACIELGKYLQWIVDKLKAKSPARRSFKLAALRVYLSTKSELVGVLHRAVLLLKDLVDGVEEEAGN